MRIKAEKATVAEVDMTPMIDIVFQLIAFFMVITNFEQTQADERVKLPKDTLCRPADVKNEHDLYVNVGFERDKQGKKLDPDPFVFVPGEKFRVLEFGTRLQLEKRLYRSRGVDPKDVTIIIRADAEVPTGLVQELIKLAQEADFQKFALKAIQTNQ